jgi:hypothetical protein
MNCQFHQMRGGDPAQISRRWFFRDCGVGLGAIALAQLLQAEGLASVGREFGDPLAPKTPPLPAKAKRVVYLFMAGAPSHLELFDYKPQLTKFDGTLPPKDLVAGYRAAFISPTSRLLGPRFKFSRQGKTGVELSELLPGLAEIANQIAIVKSMTTDAFNHAPAQILMNTGSQQFGRPSFGSWATYGLGSESRDLPGFVVLNSGKKGPSGGNSNFGSGFLPTVYNGVPFRSGAEPVLYMSNPRGIDAAVQRDTLDAVRALNTRRLEVVGDPEIATRISSFEMAYRMQSSGPELADLSHEPKSILDMYGAEPGKPSFASNCLMARRLLERGVRFVQLFHEAWDQHGNLVHDLRQNCLDTDRASAALVKDLKQRGLLDDTIVLWGGEFGRTPMAEGGRDGRDHHPNTFTYWMAGGGIKPGFVLGKSDDFGFNVVEDRVHVHDLHATLLRLLGFDHTKLTYRFQGRDFRLTDVAGKVVDKLLA